MPELNSETQQQTAGANKGQEVAGELVAIREAAQAAEAAPVAERVAEPVAGPDANLAASDMVSEAHDDAVAAARAQVEAATAETPEAASNSKITAADVASGRLGWAWASARLARRRENKAAKEAAMTPDELKKSMKRRRIVAATGAAAAVGVGTYMAAKHGADHQGALPGGHEHTLNDPPPGVTLQAETASKLMQKVAKPHANEHTAGAMEAMASNNILAKVTKLFGRRKPGEQ
jgi:hypothetical protein